MGYFEEITCYRGLTITKRIAVPMNDDPVLPCETVSIGLPLVGAAVEANRDHGYYRPAVPGTFGFAVPLSAEIDLHRAVLALNGHVSPHELNQKGQIELGVRKTAGEEVIWEIAGSSHGIQIALGSG